MVTQGKQCLEELNLFLKFLIKHREKKNGVAFTTPSQFFTRHLDGYYFKHMFQNILSFTYKKNIKCLFYVHIVKKSFFRCKNDHFSENSVFVKSQSENNMYENGEVGEVQVK